jgi:hypothetical protein
MVCLTVALACQQRASEARVEGSLDGKGQQRRVQHVQDVREVDEPYGGRLVPVNERGVATDGWNEGKTDTYVVA